MVLRATALGTWISAESGVQTSPGQETLVTLSSTKSIWFPCAHPHTRQPGKGMDGQHRRHCRSRSPWLCTRSARSWEAELARPLLLAELPEEALEPHRARKEIRSCDLHGLSKTRCLFSPVAASILKESHQASP